MNTDGFHAKTLRRKVNVCGEALLESGDKKGAIENYKKRLELDPSNDSAREVLKKIGET